MRFSSTLLCTALLGLIGSSSYVDAHAKLVSPAAWNANPSKTGPCGVTGGGNPAAFKATQISTTNAATTFNVQWTVVVADGAGPLTAKLDTTAKVNPTNADFTMTLASTGTNNPTSTAAGVNPYTVQFTIPANTKCTGPGNTCTLRLASSSGWVACSTVKIGAAVVTAAPTTVAPVTTAPTTRAPTTQAPTVPGSTPAPTSPPTTPVPTTAAPTTLAPVTAAPTDAADSYYTFATSKNACTVPTTLSVCSSVNGKNVQLTASDISIVEGLVLEDVNFGLTNPAVMTTPGVAGCRQAYTDLLCAAAFPPCGSDVQVVCTSSCTRVNNLCTPNATLIVEDDGASSSHAQLYDCSNVRNGFTATVSDSNGACPSVIDGSRPTTTSSPDTTNAPTQTPTQSTPSKSSASSVYSSTVVMAVISSLIAFVARV